MPSSSGANGVTHILSDGEGWLFDLFTPTFPHLSELLEIGAVWHNKVRVRENTWVKTGDYVRVHPQSRRYQANLDDPSSMIRFSGENFVVVDKPAGLPVHSTIDNAVENIMARLTPLLGPLFVTQRLDTGTTGLFILGRTREFQVSFNKQLIRRRVYKRYVALCETPPPLGLWTHYSSLNYQLPKVFSSVPSEGARECQARALSTTPISEVFEVLLEPLTGRTHQLRAQMAAMGSPILGDTLYGGTLCEGFGPQGFALHCTGLGFDSYRGSWSWYSPPPWRRSP